MGRITESIQNPSGGRISQNMIATKEEPKKSILEKGASFGNKIADLTGIGGVSRAIGEAIGLPILTSKADEANARVNDILNQASKLKPNDPERKKLLNEARLISSKVSSAIDTALKDLPTPTQAAGSIGKLGLNVATVASGGATAGLKGISQAGLTRAGMLGTGLRAAETAAMATGLTATSAIEEGRKPTKGELTLAAVLGAAIPIATEGASLLYKTLTKGLPERLINSEIKPRLTDLAYGKNPGRAVVKEKITANSLEELSEKLSPLVEKRGQELSHMYVQYGNKVADYSDTLNILDDAIKEANKNPRTNSAIINRLQNIKDDLMGITEIPEKIIPGTPREISSTLGKNRFDNVLDLRNKTGPSTSDIFGRRQVIPAKTQATRQFDGLVPEQAFRLKKDIGELTKWTGNASDDKFVNKTLQKMYRAVDQKLDELIPGLKQANDHWSDLLSAKKATDYRMQIEQRQNMLSLATKLGGIMAVGSDIMDGSFGLTGKSGALVLMISAMAGSTAAKTRIANIVSRLEPAAERSLLREFPLIQRIIGE